MKKNALSLSALALATALYGHTAQAELPRDFQEFKARYQQEDRVPEGALKLYFEAVFCYIDEATRSEGAKMLRYAMHLDRPLEQVGSYATFVSRMQDPDENYVFRSFAAGTSPQNGYHMSPDNFELMIVRRASETDYLALYLHSSGADSQRGVWMKEYGGLWYTINNASTYSQVRAPQSQIERHKNAHDADFDTVGGC
jgi:hypothetical protein